MLKWFSEKVNALGVWLHWKSGGSLNSLLNEYETVDRGLELQSAHEALMTRLCWMKILEDNNFYDWKSRLLTARDNLETAWGKNRTDAFFKRLLIEYPKE